MRTVLLAGVFVAGGIATAIAGGPYTPPGRGVLGSYHDMNRIDVGNQDPEGRVCAFCHTPHHAAADPTGTPQPLWSHQYTEANPAKANMEPYRSPYYDLVIDDPLIGPSRLCMSCHDGVIAADQHYGKAGKFIITRDDFGGGAIGKFNTEGRYDFANDHPIGFVYADAAAQANQGSLRIFDERYRFLDRNLQRTGRTIADSLYNGYMTCATCHDVHNRENVVSTKSTERNYFVYAPQDNSALCISCHNKAAGN